MIKFKDLTGKKFGKLTVLNVTDRKRAIKSRDKYWLCRCDCGNLTIKCGKLLRTGGAKSCGCLQREIARKTCVERNKLHFHGLTKTRLYSIWCGMKQRCNDEKANNYYLYGDKGVRVCDQWMKDFKSFYNWSIRSGYNDDLTIDRIDGTKGYSPENCRWITPKDQNRNTCRNVNFLVNDKKLCCKDVCALVDLKYSTVFRRIHTCNKTKIEDIFKGGKDLEKYKIERI